MESIWQLRLIDGTELFADVVDWGDDTGEMVIQNGMSIFKIDTATGISYYTLKPFMTGQTIDQAVSVNADAIIAAGIPSASLVDQYLMTVKTMADKDKEDKEPQVEEESHDQSLDRLENIIGVDFGKGKKPVH